MAQRTKFEDVKSIFDGRLRGNQAMLSGLGLTPEEARLLWQAPRMQEVSSMKQESGGKYSPSFSTA